jgi:hypothetical protein
LLTVLKEIHNHIKETIDKDTLYTQTKKEVLEMIFCGNQIRYMNYSCHVTKCIKIIQLCLINWIVKWSSMNTDWRYIKPFELLTYNQQFKIWTYKNTIYIWNEKLLKLTELIHRIYSLNIVQLLHSNAKSNSDFISVERVLFSILLIFSCVR